METVVKTKVCSKCKLEKALEDFNRNAKSKDGRFTYCRECDRAANRQWHHLNVAERKVKDANDKAKLLGAVGVLRPENWLAIVERQEGKCGACGKKCRLTLDHIVPLSLGGSNLPANIQGLCKRDNCRKSQGSVAYRDADAERDPALLSFEILNIDIVNGVVAGRFFVKSWLARALTGPVAALPEKAVA